MELLKLSEIIGQEIVDFFFCYFNNELDNAHSAYIKLSNAHYITERSYAPTGIPVGLILLDEKQFLEERDSLFTRLSSLVPFGPLGYVRKVRFAPLRYRKNKTHSDSCGILFVDLAGRKNIWSVFPLPVQI